MKEQPDPAQAAEQASRHAETPKRGVNPQGEAQNVTSAYLLLRSSMADYALCVSAQACPMARTNGRLTRPFVSWMRRQRMVRTRLPLPLGAWAVSRVDLPEQRSYPHGREAALHERPHWRAGRSQSD